MNTRKFLSGLFKDDDTFKLLDIAHHFLEFYFGHLPEQASEIMVAFFNEFGPRFDENVVHHESSYRMAAIIHYLTYLKGSPDKLGDWMLETGTNHQPREAVEYFQEHYYVKQ